MLPGGPLPCVQEPATDPYAEEEGVASANS